MTEPVRGSFRQPFEEQLRALELRLRNQIGTAKWDDLEKAQHERAFVVAGVVRADILDDLGKAVLKAAKDGTGFEAFKKDFRSIVETRGWHGWTGEGTPKGEAWRMRVIYRTNMATSYAAGRMAQLVDGKFKYWVYKHGNAKEPRLQHLAWDGVALPPDHPFWETHAPPNGWGCTCGIFGTNSLAGIKRLGGDANKLLPKDWNRVDPKTGAPIGIDKGWDYKVGGSAASDILDAEKLSKLPPEIGADLGAAMASPIDAAWKQWLAETISGVSHKPGLVGVLPQNVITELQKVDIKPASSEMVVAPGIVAGPKADRHAISGDALTDQDWLTLPIALRSPRAVCLDVKTGNLIFVLGAGDTTPQLAVTLQYFVRQPGSGQKMFNGIISAYRANLVDIKGRIVGKQLVLLTGSL